MRWYSNTGTRPSSLGTGCTPAFPAEAVAAARGAVVGATALCRAESPAITSPATALIVRVSEGEQAMAPAAIDAARHPNRAERGDIYAGVSMEEREGALIRGRQR